MITPKVITAPVKEPITVAEAKSHTRIDLDADDTLIASYIETARNYYEWRTGRTIHQTTLEYVLGVFPSKTHIVLPRATPLVSISSVKYKDSDAVETTWDSSKYIADTDSVPGCVVLGYGESWPSFTAYPVSPIRIRYVAGIATVSPVTEADNYIKYPVYLLVAGMYANRESVNVSDRGAVSQIAVDYGVEAFIAQGLTEYVF